MEYSWTRDRTHVSCIDRQILYHWATRKALAIFLLWCCGIWPQASAAPGKGGGYWKGRGHDGSWSFLGKTENVALAGKIAKQTETYCRWSRLVRLKHRHLAFTEKNQCTADHTQWEVKWFSWVRKKSLKNSTQIPANQSSYTLGLRTKALRNWDRNLDCGAFVCF